MNSLKLKAARITAGFGQEKLSKAVGMAIKSYNEKENGKKRIWLDEVALIAKTLKLSPEQILDIFFDEILTERISKSA